MLAEPNAKHQELQWRNIGYFTMNGSTQENRKLLLKISNLSMACKLYRAKSQDTVGQEFGFIYAGS